MKQFTINAVNKDDFWYYDRELKKNGCKVVCYSLWVRIYKVKDTDNEIVLDGIFANFDFQA